MVFRMTSVAPAPTRTPPPCEPSLPVIVTLLNCAVVSPRVPRSTPPPTRRPAGAVAADGCVRQRHRTEHGRHTATRVRDATPVPGDRRIRDRERTHCTGRRRSRCRAESTCRARAQRPTPSTEIPAPLIDRDQPGAAVLDGEPHDSHGTAADTRTPVRAAWPSMVETPFASVNAEFQPPLNVRSLSTKTTSVPAPMKVPVASSIMSPVLAFPTAALIDRHGAAGAAHEFPSAPPGATYQRAGRHSPLAGRPDTARAHAPSRGTRPLEPPQPERDGPDNNCENHRQ